MEEVNEDLSSEEVGELEERRVAKLNEANISEDEVLGRANDNLNSWNSFFNENINLGKQDMNFVLRDQWSQYERSEFVRLNKPAMTFNKLYDAVKKIAAEQRKNKPDLIVRSLTGHASQEQIDLRANLVRRISYNSQNDLIYQNAFMAALLGSYGAFQVGIDYENPRSFNQQINFQMIINPWETAFDPTALKPHKGDGNYCSRQYIFSKDEFFATYPYVLNPVSYVDSRMQMDMTWETRDTIIVCDYYEKDWYPVLLYKLSNGLTVSKDEWEDMQERIKMMTDLAQDSAARNIIMNEIPKIVAERQSQDYKIMHYRLIKNQIIDFAEWPSKHLPIVFVDGDSHFIEGKQYTRSFIRDARDAQRFVNYVGSEIAAEIKNRRREQWLGTPDNIVGYEQDWRNPEVQMGMLRAKPDPKTGMMPQKQQPWDLSPALLAQFQRGTQDMKEIMGFFEANQGAQGNEISGVAIEQRQLAGSMSAYVYFDNLNQAIEQAGRIVLDLLPSVYGGSERYVTVASKDGNTRSLVLNQRMPDGTIKNEISVGDYDIEIDTGPSFAVQKAASLQLFLQLVQANPQVFPLVADIIAENLDIQKREQLKERFQNLVPPEILAKESGQPPPPPKPDPQAQMMQMQQQFMQQEMQLKQAQLKEKEHEMAIKEEKLQIEKEKNKLAQVELLLNAQKAQQDAELNVFDHQANIEKSRIAHSLDSKKADMSFNAQIAKLLSDIHRDENKREKKGNE